MKFLLLLTTLIVSGAMAQGPQGTSTGGGGSFFEADIASNQVVLEQVMGKIELFFLRHPALQEHFTEFQVTDLTDRIRNTTIKVVDTKLVDKNNVERTCLNHPKQNLIECSNSELLKISDEPRVVFILMFHELLGLLNVEETSPAHPSFIDGYMISRKLARFITKVSNYDLEYNKAEDKLLLQNVNLPPFKKIPLIIAERIHRIYGGVQQIRDIMSKTGATTFRDVYGIEGSLYTVEENRIVDNKNGAHSRGFQAFPYQIQFSRDGHMMVKASMYSIEDFNGTPSGGLTKNVFKRFSLCTYTLEKDKDEITHHKLELGEVDFRLGLFQKDGSWVALTAGSGFGIHSSTFPKHLEDKFQSEGYGGREGGIVLSGRAGVEFRVALSRIYSIHGSSIFQIEKKWGLNDGSLLRSALVSQVEVNRSLGLGKGAKRNSYQRNAGLYIQSRNFVKNKAEFNGVTVDMRDQEVGGINNQLTGGVQFKW